MRKHTVAHCSTVQKQVVSALLRGSWQNFNCHDASRGPSVIAELLVNNRAKFTELGQFIAVISRLL